MAPIKAEGTARILVMGGDSIPVVFPLTEQQWFDVDSGFGIEEATPRLSDRRVLKAIWPHDSDSGYWHVPAGSNGRGIFPLSYRASVKNRQEFSILNVDGCVEIWHVILSSDGRLLDKFTLSESCMSDADDHSSGRFVDARTYVKLSRWYVEYAPMGHPQRMKRRSTYTISRQGKVRVRHKEWVSAFRVK
ncbi:MAG: hypothetical protein IPK50_15910 [Fibrobacterota bacterium]|nr:hypothetical protein [Fibrobacterota bacterium]QQS03775.1 MAG: hypothetical protein IPK50_15910 [Fibrobacterota bacterium]